MRNSVNKEFVISFGKNLRLIRNNKKMSMEALAYSADIEYSQISRIEKGKIITSISTVKSIADALGISIKELFDF